MRPSGIGSREALVASLATCSGCKASAQWLGGYAYSENIKASGLWNSQLINGVPATEQELTRFEKLAAETTSGP